MTPPTSPSIVRARDGGPIARLPMAVHTGLSHIPESLIARIARALMACRGRGPG